MTRKAYLTIGLVLALIVVGFMFVNQRGGGEVLAPTNEKVVVTEKINEIAPAQPASPAPEALSPVAAVSQTATQTITYTASGFDPKSLIIQAGDTVVFKNNSGRDFWPASAIHPTHALYPEKGGCIGSKFDACKGVSSGGSWSFIFNTAGSWKYHDHLNPALTGTVTVQ